MNPERFEIRKLSPSDDRTGFQSGNDDLDRFFKKYAGQNQWRSYIGTSYIATADDRILGFVTVALGELTSAVVSSATKKKLPSYPAPVLRIARLAVDQRYQRKGVGSALLRAMLIYATELSDRFGCVGVVVDAYPVAEPFYKKFGFVLLELTRGWLDDRPRPIVMFLSIETIFDSRGKSDF